MKNDEIIMKIDQLEYKKIVKRKIEKAAVSSYLKRKVEKLTMLDAKNIYILSIATILKLFRFWTKRNKDFVIIKVEIPPSKN